MSGWDKGAVMGGGAYGGRSLCKEETAVVSGWEGSDVGGACGRLKVGGVCGGRSLCKEEPAVVSGEGIWCGGRGRWWEGSVVGGACRNVRMGGGVGLWWGEEPVVVSGGTGQIKTNKMLTS